VIRGSKTVSDTVLKHDLCELVIAEVRTVITDDGTGVLNLAKRDFKNLQTTRASLPHEIDAPNVKNFVKLDGNLRHFISLRNLSLTLTSVTRFDQVVGITVDSGPIKSRVKHLLGGVVQAMMSPGGSIVASLKNVNGFLAVYTSPDDLIRTDFKQEGVVLKLMLHIFEELVLLLGRRSLNIEIPRMEVCKVGKPWGFNTLFGEEEWGIFLKKTGHWPSYLQKVLYKSSIEAEVYTAIEEKKKKLPVKDRW
nr:hypothetical protein [Tanacetum cinerariifolium]